MSFKDEIATFVTYATAAPAEIVQGLGKGAAALVSVQANPLVSMLLPTIEADLGGELTRFGVPLAELESAGGAVLSALNAFTQNAATAHVTGQPALTQPALSQPTA